MNSVKLQDTKSTHKNQLGFHIPTMNYLRKKLENDLFTIESKRIKYFEINLTKEVKDLYIKNYKTLIKAIKKQTNGKMTHVHRMKDLALLKCWYDPKLPNAIPIKNPMAFFTEIEKNNSRIHMEPQKTMNSQINLEQEEQRWRYQAP